MLTKLYIEALLANEELADQVSELWDAGLIPDDLAAIAWFLIATMPYPSLNSWKAYTRLYSG